MRIKRFNFSRKKKSKNYGDDDGANTVATMKQMMMMDVLVVHVELQQQLKVELMVSSRWCCGVGYISFRSVVLKVEKTNLPHGSATIGSVASSSKVVYPDTAQMIVYDPTKKSEFFSSVKPMAASASNTFQSNVTATATHVSANTFDEIPKTTPPALLAFLANLPHVDGKFLKPVPSD
ncbi:hypothetical protein F2Q68_00024290 [Brassica cretica]|uniref:Uncharacterized protein n=1 Tax=Brassica cretica TaxID=69181 RepID=A0A8S9I8H2_BRACR|nr:hypothetical protein F2Q68_00024290 [Brassica cretica]